MEGRRAEKACRQHVQVAPPFCFSRFGRQCPGSAPQVAGSSKPACDLCPVPAGRIRHSVMRRPATFRWPPPRSGVQVGVCPEVCAHVDLGEGPRPHTCLAWACSTPAGMFEVFKRYLMAQVSCTHACHAHTNGATCMHTPSHTALAHRSLTSVCLLLSRAGRGEPLHSCNCCGPGNGPPVFLPLHLLAGAGTGWSSDCRQRNTGVSMCGQRGWQMPGWCQTGVECCACGDGSPAVVGASISSGCAHSCPAAGEHGGPAGRLHSAAGRPAAGPGAGHVARLEQGGAVGLGQVPQVRLIRLGVRHSPAGACLLAWAAARLYNLQQV